MVGAQRHADSRARRVHLPEIHLVLAHLPDPIADYQQLEQIIASFVSICARKLRRNRQTAAILHVFGPVTPTGASCPSNPAVPPRPCRCRPTTPRPCWRPPGGCSATSGARPSPTSAPASCSHPSPRIPPASPCCSVPLARAVVRTRRLRAIPVALQCRRCHQRPPRDPHGQAGGGGDRYQ